MSKRYLLHAGAVAVFAVCFAVFVLFALLTGAQTARAAEDDAVKVSSVHVIWGDDQNMIRIYLDGAEFPTANEPSTQNYAYFMPYVAVNGVLLSDSIGSVTYARKGFYGDSTCYMIQMPAKETYSLKKDGTDKITVYAGCKIPMAAESGEEVAGCDYYVVSETATFFSPVNTQGTGEETFIAGSSTSVKGITVHWDASGTTDFVYIDLEGAVFTSNTDSNDHKDWFASYILVNGQPLTAGNIAWAREGQYGRTSQFCIQLPGGVLRQDGTDSITVQAGCRIPLNNGAGCYVVEETETYLSSGTSSAGAEEAFSKQFIWETGKEYDADSEIFAVTQGKTDALGGFSSLAVTIGNMPAEHPEWGLPLTEYSAQTNGSLAVEQFAEYKFNTPIDLASTGAKSANLTFLYNGASLFYVYPLGVQTLGYESAVQSFRTTSGSQQVTVSLEGLAEDGKCGGFILQLIDGTGAQFFLDSVTLSAESYDAGKVVKPEEPVQPMKKADVKVTGVQVVWNSASSNWIYLTLDKATYAANEDLAAQFEYFMPYISVNGTPLSENAGSVIMARRGHFGEPTRFMIEVKAGQSYSLKNDGKDVITIEQGCRFPIEGSGSVDYYEVAEKASFRSVSGGNHALDANPETFGKQVEWTLGKEYDADGEIFAVTQGQTDALGGFSSLAVSIGNMPAEHPEWGLPLTEYSAQTNGSLAVEQFAEYKFNTPIDLASTGAKSANLTFLYNGASLFYVYPLGVQTLGYESAVQSFRTTSGSQQVTVSLEGLAQEGICGGFILQLADGTGAQFFLDSVTLSAESFDAGEVEEVVEFEWTLDTKIDVGSAVIKPNGAGSIGEFTTQGMTLGSGHEAWGLTGGDAYTQNLAKNDYFVVEFVLPLENTAVKSFSIEVLHNATTCFYVYPLGTTELGFDNAVQSFRTSNGYSTIELSATELFKDGVCGGFIVQAMTDSGVQFFLDSITLSEKAVQAEVEDLTEPEYATDTVSIVEVTYTYSYEGGYDDLLLITFDRTIFNKNSDKGLNNERVGLDDFAQYLLINGVSVAESGIGDYALRSMWERHDRLGIFIKNGQTGSLNNDAFDAITFAKGFAIRGSTGDYTMYTLESDMVFYTNRALETGKQVTMSQESDPQVDQTLTPLSAAWSVAGSEATVTVMFDKTVRMDGSDFTENLLRYVRVDGKALSEWESAVTVTFEGMAIRFTFATTLTADADVRITVEKGMNVQTNPDEALSKKAVQATKEFVRGENKENYFFAEGGTLNVYWATTPEAASEEDAEYVAFDLRLSVNNATYEQFDSAVLKNILIGEKDLLSILTEKSGASVTLSGYTLRVKIPASYLVKGLVITVKQGFKTPAGGVLAADERFVYDEMFELFEGEVHREEIEGELKPTDVNTILTATDGVAPGTNQLFIEFTTPCSTKYLPFMQADEGTIYASYGSVGVTMPAPYVYELTRYGMRESLWEYLLLDGKTLREWAETDGGGEAMRYIDMYYQGTNFGVYYLQIVITAQSSAVMDWSEAHTITFKEGFVTPAFGVFEKDVQYAWNPETKAWTPDESAMATVDPNAQLKEESGEEQIVVTGGGCSGSAAGTTVLLAAAFVGASAAALKKRADKGVKRRK